MQNNTLTTMITDALLADRITVDQSIDMLRRVREGEISREDAVEMLRLPACAGWVN